MQIRSGTLHTVMTNASLSHWRSHYRARTSSAADILKEILIYVKFTKFGSYACKVRSFCLFWPCALCLSVHSKTLQKWLPVSFGY